MGNKALSTLQKGGSFVFLLLLFSFKKMRAWMKRFVFLYINLNSFHAEDMSHSAEQVEK